MTTIEEIELARYRRELDHDLRHMVDKYCRIMGWEVPELDEHVRTVASIIGIGGVMCILSGGSAWFGKKIGVAKIEKADV